MSKPKFVPTSAMIEAAGQVFFAMALVQTIEPIVRNYQAHVLKQGQWSIRPDHLELLQKRHTDPEPFESKVLDPKEIYLLSESDLELCVAQFDAERIKAKLKVRRQGNCPLLEAQSRLIDAKHRLVEVMTPITKVTLEKITTAPVRLYNEYIELNLKLLAPFVDRDAAIANACTLPCNG